jgi:hypothetical protein
MQARSFFCISSGSIGNSLFFSCCWHFTTPFFLGSDKERERVSEVVAGLLAPVTTRSCTDGGARESEQVAAAADSDRPTPTQSVAESKKFADWTGS